MPVPVAREKKSSWLCSTFSQFVIPRPCAEKDLNYQHTHLPRPKTKLFLSCFCRTSQTAPPPPGEKHGGYLEGRGKWERLQMFLDPSLRPPSMSHLPLFLLYSSPLPKSVPRYYRTFARRGNRRGYARRAPALVGESHLSCMLCVCTARRKRRSGEERTRPGFALSRHVSFSQPVLKLPFVSLRNLSICFCPLRIPPPRE